MSKLRADLPIAVKRFVWNMKYGPLQRSLPVAPRDVITYLNASLSDRSFVLELGCGRASVLRGLRETGYMGHYCGVDISERAIAKASKCGDQRSSWVVSDIESFRSRFQWDAIAMVESIYYIKLNNLEPVLRRVASMLTEKGRLIIRIHDLDKHRAYIDALYAIFPLITKIDDKLFCAISPAHDREHSLANSPSDSPNA
jgi:predicted TPR repeat methyltransferase